MKLISKIASAVLLTSTLMFAAPYEIDKAHSNVGFTVKHMMITNVHGKFKAYDAEIDFDDKTKTFNKFSATVETESIDTGIEKRDAHLRDTDFFLSDMYPQMKFEMTSYKADGDEGKMKGNLTIKDVTKPVTLEIKDISILGDKVGFSIEGKINRSDFGLTWNRTVELGGVAVGEEVKIKIDLKLQKK